MKVKLGLVLAHQFLVKKQSSSSTKLSTSKLDALTDLAFNSNDINLIFNVQLLSNIVRSFIKCKYCNNSNCVDGSIKMAWPTRLPFNV